jgi:type IV pilus assembly protein PilC
MKFFYIAIDKNGKKVRGFIEASDSAKSATYLREHALVPIHVEQQEGKHTITVSPGKFLKRVTNKDVIFFTRQIASMLLAGLNLSQSLSILKNQTQKASMITVIDGIVTHVEEGKSFSESVALYPEIFYPVYISLIKAGETAGVLDKVMVRLADSLEKQDALRAKIKSALVYPFIVMILMGVVVIVMMLFVIPQLSSLYDAMNIKMPLPTQIVIVISNIVSRYLLVLIAVGVLGGLYFNKWRRSDTGKNILDTFILRVPIFGKLVQYSILTEFSRTFGLLVGTGALVIEGLQKSADVLGNNVYKRAVMQVSSKVEKGVAIGDAMGVNPLFPPMLVEMVKIGEQTGKLDESLTRVSEFFEREDEQIVKTLTAAMEPAIMVVLAIGVGFLIISIITPIYNLMSSF